MGSIAAGLPVRLIVPSALFERLVLGVEGRWHAPFAESRSKRKVKASAPIRHWRSGSVAHEQGVSKAGNPRLRTTMIQLAWLWVRHQPRSILTLWFHQRVQLSGGRVRKVLIVALARKLLIAFWKYVTAGVDSVRAAEFGDRLSTTPWPLNRRRHHRRRPTRRSRHHHIIGRPDRPSSIVAPNRTR